MIINIANKKDLITIDLRLKQIRYVKRFDCFPDEIEFINLSSGVNESFEYLFNQGEKNFLKTLSDFLLEHDILTKTKDLEVLK